MKAIELKVSRVLGFLLVLISSAIAATAYHSIKITRLPDTAYFKSLSAIAENVGQARIYRIGIVYPLGFLGEQEEAQRLCIAANKLGWGCYTFQYHWDRLLENKLLARIYRFIWGTFTKAMGVDFIIELYPTFTQVSPIGKIPTYLMVTHDMSATLSKVSINLELGRKEFIRQYLAQDLNGYNGIFWRYIGNYDGYIDSGYGWLKKFDLSLYTQLSAKDYNSHKLLAEGYPGVYATNFLSHEYKNVFYCGDNWDSLRSSDKYKEILAGLEGNGYLKVYGPPNKWQHLPGAYQGFIPIDGYSLLRKIQEAGIALILHSKNDLKDGIPTARVFEAAAASAVIISDKNKFIQREFGDCVLYIDVMKPADDIIGQIDSHVQWIRGNPEKAMDMAKCTHQKFYARFTMEKMLKEVASSHEGQKSSNSLTR